MGVKKLGLTFFSILRMSIRDILEISKASEKNNFGYITVAESFYRDGFALASAIAQNTERIQFGTSVMPIYTRTPFQLAMGTATLQEISNGRVGFLGLGVGYRARTEQFFGLKQANRIERMREYVDIIRKLLSGDDSSFHGKFFDYDGFPRLSHEPLNIPIYFGSSAAQMLELAGEIADGVILNSISTPEYVKFARERIAAGASRAGRKSSEIEICHSIVYAVADDFDEAADASKEDILFYISYPELDAVIERSPFKAEALKMRTLNLKGRKKEALSLITDEMLDIFTVCGTVDEGKAKLEKFLRRGIALPIIRVSVSPNEESERKRVFLRAIMSLTDF